MWNPRKPISKSERPVLYDNLTQTDKSGPNRKNLKGFTRDCQSFFILNPKSALMIFAKKMFVTIIRNPKKIFCSAYF